VRDIPSWEWHRVSQRTNQIIAVIAVFLIGAGGLFITVGLLQGFEPGTTTTTSDTTTSDLTTTTTTDPTTTTDTTTETTTTDTTTTDTTTTDTTTDSTTTTTTIVEDPVTLNVLTRHAIVVHSIFEPAFLASPFAIENNIVDISWSAPAGEFWDDLIDSGAPDVCWGGGPELFDLLMLGDRFSPLNSSLMQEVETRVNDTIAGIAMKRNNTADELVWIGSKLSSFGFLINHDFLATNSLPIPTTWANLSEPIYGSLLPTIPTIAMANAPDSTFHKYIYELILQMMGWDAGWVHLSRMAGSADIKGGSVEAQVAVENGDLGIVPCIDTYGFLSQFNNPDCEYIVPQDGTTIYGDPIAIPISTKNKTLSEGFIDFVLSPYGQSLWLDESIMRLPIMREAFNESGITGAEDLYSIFNQTARSSAFVINETQSLLTTYSFNGYFESVLTDSDTELVACWSEIVNLYYAGNITKSELDTYANQMADPVSITDPNTAILEKFTLEYAMRINNDMLYDSIYASTAKTRWATAAKVQYTSVLISLPTSLASPYVSKLSMMGSLQAIIVLLFGTSSFAVIALAIPKYD